MVKTVEKVTPFPTDDQEAVKAIKPATSPQDVFSNLEKHRLRQSFDKLKVRKPLTTVGIRKPKKHEWFQSHPVYREEWPLFLAEEEGVGGDWFFPVGDDVMASLEELSPKGVRQCQISWWINRKGNTFIWPVQLADMDGRQNEWHASMLDVMNAQAVGQWARIEAGDSGYTVTIAECLEDGQPISKPDWPPIEYFGEVLRVAFKKGGRVIDNVDHPLIIRLRG
jgi:hypothetical protein